jgi:phosphohistidine swiveling domain-containing protein
LDVFDICFVDYLQAKIKNELKQNRIKITEQEMLDLFRELSDPVYTTFIAKEEKMIAQAALKKQMVESSAKKLEGKYWWIGIGWEGIVVRGDAYYKKEIQKYSKKKNLSSMIKEIDERPKEIKKKRDGILAKYKLSKGIGELLDVFDRFTYFHDLRKEMQMRTVYSFDLLLSEVVKRFKIRLSDKELYSRKEIKGILAGKKVDSIDLNGRKKTILVLVTKKGIKTLVGDEAIRFRRKELDQDSEDVTELKGIGVTKGKIRARVKVCNGINDARDKMKKGDILVTGMTLPDYVPVMKIASAIITNEGGITCHAAIVSRELGIPCIVGTKIATQVLQDGDLVEVDADKGIVKIIEKKYN